VFGPEHIPADWQQFIMGARTHAQGSSLAVLRRNEMILPVRKEANGNNVFQLNFRFR